MRFLSLTLAAAVSVASFSMPTVSIAAPGSDCVCTAISIPGRAVGRLLAFTNNVYVSGQAGLNNVALSDVGNGSSLPLNINSQVTTGPGSSAEVLVGSGCNVSVGENAKISFSAAGGGNVCVRTFEQAIAAHSTDWWWLAAALAVGGGVVLYLALQNNGSQPEPPPPVSQ